MSTILQTKLQTNEPLQHNKFHFYVKIYDIFMEKPQLFSGKQTTPLKKQRSLKSWT